MASCASRAALEGWLPSGQSQAQRKCTTMRKSRFSRQTYCQTPLSESYSPQQGWRSRHAPRWRNPTKSNGLVCSAGRAAGEHNLCGMVCGTRLEISSRRKQGELKGGLRGETNLLGAVCRTMSSAEKNHRLSRGRGQ